MEQNLGYGPAQGNGARSTSENSSPKQLSQIEQDLKDVIGALALLGLKRCSQCKQFFRSDPGALFENGEIVCYQCVPDWWSSLSPTLSIADRNKIEAKLSSWLRRYHRAAVLKEDPGNAADNAVLQIVTTCAECRGAGKLLEGERCRFCNGRGTVWIVVPR